MTQIAHPSQELSALAEEAFLYGFPLVFDLEQVERFVRHGIGAVPATPFNEFGHAAALAGPEETFVSINNDTIYSIAMVDAAGPVRLDVPDAAGRYYVLQFVDAWTNNFAYVGHRATGTKAASFLLVPPGWQGETPAGLTVIRLPTAVATIVGRWAVDGEADLPAVQALQAGLTLKPTRAGGGLPKPDEEVPAELRFFERMRVWMAAFAPPAREHGLRSRLEPLGLLDESSPYRDARPELAAALSEGLAAGKARLEAIARDSGSPRQNGWDLTYHVFDYNLDFFEVGALDEPRWKLPDDASRFMSRAAAARGGLWGNHGYEAAYAMVHVDGDGRQLDGGERYELHFASPPPCKAFWSVTMYDAQDYFLVANPIQRYSIGDRTRGLHAAADGSLTIAIQREEPSDPERRANWLPAPDGPFRPILRMYEPDDAVFDGSYELPPIVRVS